MEQPEGATERTIMASEFKKHCLALLNRVAETRVSLVVTKYGKPVARVVPLDDAPTPTDGSVTLLSEDDDAYFSTGETWHAEGSGG